MTTHKQGLLAAALGVVAVLAIFVAFPLGVHFTTPESPRNDISLYNEIAALHEQGLNAWDDYEYWEEIITRDISHRVEIVCAHGVAFFLHNEQLIPMDIVNRVNFHEARDVCAKRERKYTND